MDIVLRKKVHLAHSWLITIVILSDSYMEEVEMIVENQARI